MLLPDAGPPRVKLVKHRVFCVAAEEGGPACCRTCRGLSTNRYCMPGSPLGRLQISFQRKGGEVSIMLAVDSPCMLNPLSVYSLFLS